MSEPGTALTKREQQRLEKKAHTLDQAFRQWVAAQRQLWPAGAAICYEINQERIWDLLGYDSLEAYLADPDVAEVGRREFFHLCAIHEKLVLSAGVDPERLGRIAKSRVKELMPAIASGKIEVDDALAKAEVTPVADLREILKDPDAPIDPSKEKRPCPTCGSRVSPEKLNGGKA